MLFSKEINKQENVNHLLLTKTGILKTWKVQFFGKKFEKIH